MAGRPCISRKPVGYATTAGAEPSGLIVVTMVSDTDAVVSVATDQGIDAARVTHVALVPDRGWSGGQRVRRGDLGGSGWTASGPLARVWA